MANISRNPILFTGEEKTFLGSGEFLRNGEYLFSPDGAWRLGLWGKKEAPGTKSTLFVFRIDPKDRKKYHIAWRVEFEAHDDIYGVMQTDGNFCVYQGKEPENQGKCLWATGTNQAQQVDWTVHMQQDGNFCVYNGNYASYRPGVIAWQAGFNQGLADHYEITDIVYHYDRMTAFQPEFVTAYSDVVENNSSKDLETSVMISITKKATWSWETASASTLTVKTSAQLSLLDVAKIGTEFTGSLTEHSAQGGENSTEQTDTHQVKITVPPYRAMKVVAYLTREKRKIPYTYQGAFVLKHTPAFEEGSYCELEGIFTVENGARFQVYCQELSLSSAGKTETIAGNLNGIGEVTAVVSNDVQLFESVGEPVRLEEKDIIKL